MKTEDQTLCQFLEQFSIGELIDVVPQQILIAQGHTEISSAGVEILTYCLGREFEKGELSSYAVSYFMRQGYSTLLIENLQYSGVVPPEYSGVLNFDFGTIISAIDPDRGNDIINVCYSATHCLFHKMSGALS